MSSVEISHMDLEQGGHRHSFAGSETSTDGSVCFSEADYDSCHSRFDSTAGGSYNEYRFSCVFEPQIVDESDSRRMSSMSDCSVEVEIVSVVPEIKVHLGKVERDCRICQLGLECNENGTLMELGCSCKDDLGSAHKLCAETWFQIKGNKICEICHSLARNVGAPEGESIDQLNQTNSVTIPLSVLAPMFSVETRSFWHGHRLLKFLLACIVFAFVISWLLHFKVPS